MEPRLEFLVMAFDIALQGVELHRETGQPGTIRTQER